MTDVDLAGKRVFIRADLNVPQDDGGKITDDTRIRASVPAIQQALQARAAVMVTSHLGRPTEGELKPEDSLAPIAQRLSELIGKPVPLDRLNEVLTFLEPHALTRRRAESAKHERRRGPRAQIGFPVRIVEYKGTAWDGVCTELSATGMKIRFNGVLPEGAAVKLLFTPPDGAVAVEVISLVVRVDRDATAFSFVHLANAEARRLGELVRRLQRP